VKPSLANVYKIDTNLHYPTKMMNRWKF